MAFRIHYGVKKYSPYANRKKTSSKEVKRLEIYRKVGKSGFVLLKFVARDIELTHSQVNLEQLSWFLMRCPVQLRQHG